MSPSSFAVVVVVVGGGVVGGSGGGRKVHQYFYYLSIHCYMLLCEYKAVSRDTLAGQWLKYWRLMISVNTLRCCCALQNILCLYIFVLITSFN